MIPPMSENLNTKRNRLLAIVQEFAARGAIITDASDMYHDVKIRGDDISWFLEAIIKEFGTDLSEFEWRLYFADPEENIVPYLRRRFGRLDDKKRLTFGHLLAVVERGAWFE
jgi:uncharacterized protein DUF1493